MPDVHNYQTAFACLYERYNRREFVHPDPLEFLYAYEDPLDREIVGLIAAGLAYGNVKQILKSVRVVLDRLDRPRRFLEDASQDALLHTFSAFKHRFTTGEELATLLFGIRHVVRTYGSLERCFLSHSRVDHDTILPALEGLVGELSSVFPERPRSLLPAPSRGSACKRLNLYLRWMVRKDHVDPGGWDAISPARLIIPLDVHMHRICRGLGLTARNQGDLKTAHEITAAFRKISPDDPARYDFALTRFGIRKELNPDDLFALCEQP